MKLTEYRDNSNNGPFHYDFSFVRLILKRMKIDILVKYKFYDFYTVTKEQYHASNAIPHNLCALFLQGFFHE